MLYYLLISVLLLQRLGLVHASSAVLLLLLLIFLNVLPLVRYISLDVYNVRVILNFGVCRFDQNVILTVSDTFRMVRGTQILSLLLH